MKNLPVLFHLRGPGWDITDSFLRYAGAIVLAIVFAIVAALTDNDGLRTALIGFIGACVGFVVGTASAKNE